MKLPARTRSDGGRLLFKMGFPRECHACEAFAIRFNLERTRCPVVFVLTSRVGVPELFKFTRGCAPIRFNKTGETSMGPWRCLVPSDGSNQARRLLRESKLRKRSFGEKKKSVRMHMTYIMHELKKRRNTNMRRRMDKNSHNHLNLIYHINVQNTGTKKTSP